MAGRVLDRMDWLVHQNLIATLTVRTVRSAHLQTYSYQEPENSRPYGEVRMLEYLTEACPWTHGLPQHILTISVTLLLRFLEKKKSACKRTIISCRLCMRKSMCSSTPHMVIERAPCRLEGKTPLTAM